MFRRPAGPLLTRLPLSLIATIRTSSLDMALRGNRRAADVLTVVALLLGLAAAAAGRAEPLSPAANTTHWPGPAVSYWQPGADYDGVPSRFATVVAPQEGELELEKRCVAPRPRCRALHP